jgi:flagellar basal-body rod modification protein FlgD
MQAISATKSTTATLASETATKVDGVVAANEGDVNRDMFLKLLVAQLKNQDPSSPMDAQGFVGQLAGFSELENSIAMKQSLEQIKNLIQNQNNIQQP